MPAHAGMRTRVAAGGGRPAPVPGPGSGSGPGPGRVRVPYPAWFFLNPVSRVWVALLPEPDPIRSATQTARSPTDPNRPPTAV